LEYSSKTNQHGAYSFESLPPDTYRLDVDLPAGLSTWQQNMGKPLTVQLGLTEASSGCRADLFARPDGRISGVIIDAEGRPVAGFVTIRPADPAEAEAARRRGGLPGYTTENGKFSFRQIPPGKYQLLAYPKIGEQINLRSAIVSEIIDLALGQHIENFRFKVSRSPNSSQ
jgi:protocatechuate 3,4-dioxygenase beta subunit